MDSSCHRANSFCDPGYCFGRIIIVAVSSFNLVFSCLYFVGLLVHAASFSIIIKCLVGTIIKPIFVCPRKYKVCLHACTFVWS